MRLEGSFDSYQSQPHLKKFDKYQVILRDASHAGSSGGTELKKMAKVEGYF